MKVHYNKYCLFIIYFESFFYFILFYFKFPKDIKYNKNLSISKFFFLYLFIDNIVILYNK